MGRRLLSLDDHILGLERFDDREQDNKDKVFERVQARCEYEASTGCLIYTGAWEVNGQAKIRVGGRVYCLSRVAAWLYVPGFRLWGLERAVRKCDSPACCNEEHIEVLASQAQAIAAQRKRGRLGNARHKLTRALAREARVLHGEGVPLEEIAAGLGVRRAAILAVVLGRTWPEKEAS